MHCFCVRFRCKLGRHKLSPHLSIFYYTNGEGPNSVLVQGTEGNFYGVTANGEDYEAN